MIVTARKGSALVAAGSLMLVGAVVLPAMQASATSEIHKSYVCKYVTTPGEGEILQTGQNPIWVDNSSLIGHDDVTFVGEQFTDAQGRSVVIVANTAMLDPEPTVADCPPPGPPPTSTTSTTTTPTETTSTTSATSTTSTTSTTSSTTTTPTSTTTTTGTFPTPVQFNATGLVSPPTCEAAGSLLQDAFPGVSITVDPPFDGPGTYTITASLDDPVNTTFEDGTTEPKTVEVTVLGALGFQSTDPAAPCFLASTDTTTTTGTGTSSTSSSGTTSNGGGGGGGTGATPVDTVVPVNSAVPSNGLAFTGMSMGLGAVGLLVLLLGLIFMALSRRAAKH